MSAYNTKRLQLLESTEIAPRKQGPLMQEVDIKEFVQEFISAAKEKEVYLLIEPISFELLAVHSPDARNIRALLRTLVTVYEELVTAVAPQVDLEPIIMLIEEYMKILIDRGFRNVEPRFN